MEELLENIKSMLSSKDQDSVFLAVQILLQDIDTEVKVQLMFDLLESDKIRDENLKQDIIKLFHQCKHDISKYKIKKL